MSDSVGLNTNADILFVISDLGSGGAQRVLHTMTGALADSGRQVWVATLSNRETDFFQLRPQVTRRVVGWRADSINIMQALVANCRRILAIRRVVKESGAPVVFGFVGVINILVVFACIGLRRHVVVSERNDPNRQSLGRLWDLLRRLTYRHADVVTANSRGVLLSLEQFVPKGRLKWLPNPVDRQSIAVPALRENTVLSVGRLHYQKGHDVLLRAFAKTAMQFPDWQLAIVGEGPMEAELAALTTALEISERVSWCGRHDDVQPFYEQAKIFVLASRYEGVPNALLEAMSNGLAVVVTDASPGPLEYVSDNESGLIVPADDVDKLREALSALMSSKMLRARLGDTARKSVSCLQLDNVLPIWHAVINPEVL